MLTTLRKYHFIGADEYEEDSLLLSYSFCFGMYFHMSPDPVSPFAEWMFNDVDKEAAYLLHKQMIQLLSMKYQPKSCWLLKAPLHSFYPEVLLKTYVFHSSLHTAILCTAPTIASLSPHQKCAVFPIESERRE